MTFSPLLQEATCQGKEALCAATSGLQSSSLEEETEVWTLQILFLEPLSF